MNIKNYDKKDIYYMTVALLTARNSTCSRLATGTVLVSDKGRIISTGHNGVMTGLAHCQEINKEKKTPCRCVHSEQNSIVHCPEPFTSWKKAYVTDTPCYSCMKLLLSYHVKEIYYFRRYRADQDSFKLAKEANIKMVHVPEYFQIEVPHKNWDK